MRMMYCPVSDTGILGKRKSECSYQESNLRPPDYYFGFSTIYSAQSTVEYAWTFLCVLSVPFVAILDIKHAKPDKYFFNDRGGNFSVQTCKMCSIKF